MATTRQKARKRKQRANHNKVNNTRVITEGKLAGTKVKNGPGYHEYEMPGVAWAHAVKNGIPQEDQPKEQWGAIKIVNSDKGKHAGSITVDPDTKFGDSITYGDQGEELAPGVEPGIHPELGLAKADSGKGKREFALEMARASGVDYLTTEDPDGTLHTMTREEIMEPIASEPRPSQLLLDDCAAKAKKQKKTAVMIRGMAKSGWEPKEGVDPKPSKTTVDDWQLIR